VVAQIKAVLSALGVDAAKTGMLLSAPIMDAIAATLTQTPIANLVVDPVMVSRTGAVLIDEDAIATLKARILPLAAIVTPNRYEAELLTGLKMDSVQAMEQAARQIQTLGPQTVLVKGGSFTGALRGTDVWFDGEHCEVLTAKPIDTPHTHGTGCTLSAAIAAHLALGRDRRTAVVQGKHYVSEALGYALAIGAGTGPVGHFYPLLARS
jgi:hydroxymethylpyrimidine/phosphomethylpyrimidine kinase